MIIGMGTDIVNMDRIEESLNKFGDSFIKKCFTINEANEAKEKPDQTAFFSKRFAAKEAFFKALGTGFTQGVSWQDLEISNTPSGKPQIKVQGRSLEILNKLSRDILNSSYSDLEVHISISDDKPFATSTVIIEKR